MYKAILYPKDADHKTIQISKVTNILYRGEKQTVEEFLSAPIIGGYISGVQTEDGTFMSQPGYIIAIDVFKAD